MDDLSLGLPTSWPLSGASNALLSPTDADMFSALPCPSREPSTTGVNPSSCDCRTAAPAIHMNFTCLEFGSY